MRYRSAWGRGVACAVATGLLATAAVPAWAHHSTAAYDYAKSETVSGTVKEFQWTNPHMYIVLLAPDTGGTLRAWKIECGTPNIDVRHGWQYTDVKSGDQVRLLSHPMRDEPVAGTLDTIWTASGKMLYAPGRDLVAANKKG